VPTFLERAKEVIAEQTKDAKGKRPAYPWERSLLHFAKPLHGLLVTAITTEDVKKVLDPIWLTKKPTARTARKHMAKVFSSCISDELISRNPAALEDNLEHKLKKQKHKTRHHPAMPYAEVPAYVAALEAHGTMSALALAFTILTCVRSAEAYTGRHGDIDGDNLWNVRSGDEMKNGLFARVPLPSKALEILCAAKALAEKRGYPTTHFFPGLDDGHISSYAMRKHLQSTHPQFTVHGFRASFRSWGQAEVTGIEPDTLEYCLHHIEGSRTEQAYMREECVAKRRAALETWAAYVAPRKRGLKLVA
jgi:integrase